MVLASITPVNAYGTAKFIVSATPGQGNYTTITAALAAAASGDTIFIRNGTYTENITLVAGVDLIAYSFSSNSYNVTIKGTVTCSYSGTVGCTGINFLTNGSSAINITGANTLSLILLQCYISANDSTGITCNNANSSILIEDGYALGTAATTLFTITSGLLYVLKSSVSGLGGPASTIASGQMNFRESIVTEVAFQTSGGGTMGGNLSVFSASNYTILTTAGASANQFSLCSFGSGTATCFVIGAGTTLTLNSCTVGSTNATTASGAGTISYGNVDCPNNSAITITTQNVLLRAPTTETYSSTVPGAYPYAVLSTDNTVLVDTSVARTINLPNAPVKGKVYIIKDAVGSAGANPITVTTPGGAVTIDGATTINLSVNYTSITVIFDGANYKIISDSTATSTSQSWIDVTGASQALAGNKSYLADRGTLVTFTLPVTCAQFSTFAVAGYGAGGWLIAQNAGQSIQAGAVSSTIGVGGSVASSNRYDAIYFICTVANTTFLTTNMIGNLTLV